MTPCFSPVTSFSPASSASKALLWGQGVRTVPLPFLQDWGAGEVGVGVKVGTEEGRSQWGFLVLPLPV